MDIININSRGNYGSAKDKALHPSARDELFNKLTNLRDRTILILGCYGGLRVGEIQQVRKEWLKRQKINDKEVLTITIPEECRDINNLYKLWRPKTKRGRTTYLFNKELWLEVENYYNYNISIQLGIRAIQNISYNKFNVNIHSLRAMAQNYFKFEMNMPIEVIAVLLGHKDINTTTKHYMSLNSAQAESYLLQKL
jgi:integrase